MSEENQYVTYDYTNMACPKPTLSAKKMAKDLGAGQMGEIRVDTDALGRVADVIKKQGVQIVEKVKTGRIGRVVFFK